MSNHHEVVKKLIDNKAVNFDVIGKIVAELGPTLAVSDDPWENFCGTMKMFIHLYRRPFPGPYLPIENLENLRNEIGGR